MRSSAVSISTSGLDRDSVVSVARNFAEVKITQSAFDALARSSKVVEDLAKSDQPVYGISTGFGALATKHIAPNDRVALQQSLIRSHAAGMGSVVETEVVRAMQLLRLRTLCSGATGVRPVVAETMAAMLNAAITPVVYEYGSLGCSGDLAPLSHCALALMGEGEVFDKSGKRRPTLEVLKENNIKPEDYFSRVAYSGAHDATAAWVQAGKVDAGVLNASVWQKLVDAGKVDTSKVRVFATTPTYYDYNWTVRGNLDAALQEKIKAAFLALDPAKPEQKAILDLQAASRFIETKPENYQGIEEAARAAGLLM